MIIAVMLAATGVIGVLFWSDRRYGGPVALSEGAQMLRDYQQNVVADDVGTFCDDYPDDACTSDDYQDSAPTESSRDE